MTKIKYKMVLEDGVIETRTSEKEYTHIVYGMYYPAIEGSAFFNEKLATIFYGAPQDFLPDTTKPTKSGKVFYCGSKKLAKQKALWLEKNTWEPFSCRAKVIIQETTKTN